MSGSKEDNKQSKHSKKMPKTAKTVATVAKPYHFPVEWAFEVTDPDWWRPYVYHHKGMDKKILDAIGAGIWTVTREGQPVKDAAYWKAEYLAERPKCSDLSHEFYRMKDKRTKAARAAKAALDHKHICLAIYELYFLRECKRENKPSRERYIDY